MKKILSEAIILIPSVLLVICQHISPQPASCQERQIQHIDFMVKNMAGSEFRGVTWIDAEEIYSLAPGFDGYSFVVTTTRSSDIQADLTKTKAEELDSQPVDENGDGRIDKIGIYLSLKPDENIIVTVHIGEMNQILRIKGQYKKICNAMETDKAIFWESDKIAYRFDLKDNYINVIGKKTQRNILDLLNVRYYETGKQSNLGEELVISQNSPGFGGIGILKGNMIQALGNYHDFRIISGGPISSVISTTASAGKSAGIDIQYTNARNSRWTIVEVTLSGESKGKQFVTCIPVRPAENLIKGEDYSGTFAGEPALGLGIYVPAEYLSSITKNSTYHIFNLKPDPKGIIRYAFSAYWELEHHQNIVYPEETDARVPEVVYSTSDKRLNRVLIRPEVKLNSPGNFEKELTYDIEVQLRHGPTVNRLSQKLTTYTELYPPEAMMSNDKKTYRESLDLMVGRMALLAEKGLGSEGNEKFWELSDAKGNPHFLKPNTGWGNGYWISMLWDSYRLSGDSRFKDWALRSNKLLLGNENRPSMVSGLDYWDGSVRSYLETGDITWKESALKVADYMQDASMKSTAGLVPVSVLKDRKDLDNPYKDLIYVKVDAMICIPILFWAYNETHDRKYLDAGRIHALNTKKYLIEPDGSAFQLSWHNPETGDLIGVGTNQGLGGNSRWARGQAWVLDGFADAFILAGDQEFADIFKKSAEWLMKNLPPDNVPWYDYDDQAVFYRYRDTSAPAISAYALLRMSDAIPDKELAKKYREFGIRIINSLIDHYLTPVSENDTRPPGMLSNQCYVKHFDSSGEQIWGSFNLMRALVWLQQKGIGR